MPTARCISRGTAPFAKASPVASVAAASEDTAPALTISCSEAEMASACLFSASASDICSCREIFSSSF